MRVRLKWLNGEARKFMIQKITRTHTNAAPGWFVGTPGVSDDGMVCMIWWEPVIAWLVCTEIIDRDADVVHSWVDPIAVQSIGHRYVIRAPDGKIYEQEVCVHADDESVLRNWREEDLIAKSLRESRARNEQK